MTDRERFVRYLLGEPVDRPPYYIFWGPWRTTWNRWQREVKQPENAEDWGLIFNSDQQSVIIPVNCGPCPPFERLVIEEDEEFITFIDEWGIKRRDFKNRESMPQFVEYPVKSRSDWERYKEERLNPDSPERLSGNWVEQCKEWTEKGYPIRLGRYPDGLFGGLRWLLGVEGCLLAFYTMPDLVHEIMDHLTSLWLTVFEKVVKIVQVDEIHIWEDMCGKQGPLISPKHWDEFMGPNYKRIKKFANEHNIPIMSVDTDGNPDLIIPSMMRAGVNYLYPMEVSAGCDVNIFRDKYPLLGMMGGIDKRVLADGHGGHKAIDRELQRIMPAVKKGRYIPELDHCVPDNVSWENYYYYAHALKRLIGKT
ncbi:MAG: uroporphyrinogen decarboxylase family protein [Candidatus Hodarchaeales archaeon]